MKKRKPVGVGDILARLIKKTSLGDQMEKAEIWENWPDLAGKNLAPHGQPRGIRDNTLIVQAESSVWMHKFAYHKWDILKRINLHAQRELISDIFIVLDSEDPPTPNAPAALAPAAAPKKRPKRKPPTAYPQ